jgi:hypothetical protein
MDIRIKGLDQVMRQLGEFADKVAAPAIAAALNKAADQAKTAMAREISAEYMLGVREVRERLKIRRATARAGGLQAALYVEPRYGKKGQNVARFVVGRKMTTAEMRRKAKAGALKPLMVKIKRNGPAKPLPGAFLGNDKRTVFRRVGASRLPIEGVTTIGVEEMFGARRINEKVVRMIREKLPQLIEHELQFRLKRLTGKA